MPLPPQVADLTSFDLLLSVARLGSVGRAAAEHRVSQPAASARLRQLERRLGVTLLHRTTRGSTLTPTGALVADWARTAVEAASALALGVAALRDTYTRRLAIAASQTVAEYLLPAWLVALRAAHPDLSVVLQSANSDDVAARVLAGETALGFIEGPDLPSGLHAATVAADSLTVVVAPGHPWTRRRRGVTAEMPGYPLLDIGEAGRVQAVKRAHRPVCIPPFLRHGGETRNLVRVNAECGGAIHHLSSLSSCRAACARFERVLRPGRHDGRGWRMNGSRDGP